MGSLSCGQASHRQADDLYAFDRGCSQYNPLTSPDARSFFEESAGFMGEVVPARQLSLNRLNLKIPNQDGRSLLKKLHAD